MKKSHHGLGFYLKAGGFCDAKYYSYICTALCDGVRTYDNKKR